MEIVVYSDTGHRFSLSVPRVFENRVLIKYLSIRQRKLQEAKDNCIMKTS
jgi:hypothetical protein